jgi:hypothetical protein
MEMIFEPAFKVDIMWIFRLVPFLQPIQIRPIPSMYS